MIYKIKKLPLERVMAPWIRLGASLASYWKPIRGEVGFLLQSSCVFYTRSVNTDRKKVLPHIQAFSQEEAQYWASSKSSIGNTLGRKGYIAIV